GRSMPDLASSFCRSSPLTPGSLTSSTRQPGASGRLASRNSCGAENDCTTRPTDWSSADRASRMCRSSSTMKTTGCSSFMTRLRAAVLVYRQCEKERGPPGLVCPGPEPFAVRLDDRAADGKPRAYTVGFCRVEGITQMRQHLRRKPGPRVAHCNQHAV